MPDLGIGEGIAALFGGGDLLAGLGGLFGGGAAAAAPEAAAIALPEIAVGAGDVGAGLAGADAAALGAAAAGGIPNIVIPAAASSFGVGDAVAGGIGSLLGIGAAEAGGLTPNSIVSGEFGVVNNAIQTGDIQPTGGTTPNSFQAPGAAAPPSATGATTAAAPAGVSPAISADPTALDSLAAGGTPSGGIAGGGLTPTAPITAPTAANVGGTAAGTAASTTPTSPFSIESLVGSVGKSIAANPVGLTLAGGGLLYSVMSGEQMGAAQKKLQEEAAALNPQGQQLMSYLTSGTLPPALKASLDQATAAAKANVISNYASQGLSTDPQHNSALAQQLQMIDQQAVISIATIGQQLYSSGLQTAGLSSQLYTSLAQMDQTQTANIGKAIANFAAAVSPSKGLTLNLGGSKAA